MAIEEGVTRFLERARRVGLFSTTPAEPRIADQERFDEHLRDLR